VDSITNRYTRVVNDDDLIVTHQIYRLVIGFISQYFHHVVPTKIFVAASARPAKTEGLAGVVDKVPFVCK
jgi:hypothetical protein